MYQIRGFQKIIAVSELLAADGSNVDKETGIMWDNTLMLARCVTRVMTSF